MKRILCFVFTIIFVVAFLCSCDEGNSTTLSRFKPAPVDSDYVAYKTDVGCFLTIINSPYPNGFLNQGTDSQSAIRLGLNFDSLDELIDCVTDYKLEDWQLGHVEYLFPRNSDGIIPICDFDNMYIPKLPSNGEIVNVAWRGEEYGFTINVEDYCQGSVYVRTEENYLEDFAQNVDDFSKTHTITKTEKSSDKKATVYYYSTEKAELKCIIYKFEKNGAKYTVKEEYTLKNHKLDVKESETIPESVHVFIEKNHVFLELSLDGFSERPSKAFISDFGFKLYSE